MHLISTYGKGQIADHSTRANIGPRIGTKEASIGPGSVIEWEEKGEEIVVKRSIFIRLTTFTERSSR